MKRRLMQLVFAVGLLLTLAAGTMWARTIWVIDTVALQRQLVEPVDQLWTQGFRLETRRSSLVLTYWRARMIQATQLQTLDLYDEPWHMVHDTWDVTQHGRPASGARNSWQWLGFFRWSGPAIEVIGVPTWFVVLIPAAPTALATVWLRRDRRRRVRRSEGLCPTCGYDLRGADHERCSEVGQFVSHDIPSSPLTPA